MTRWTLGADLDDTPPPPPQPPHPRDALVLDAVAEALAGHYEAAELAEPVTPGECFVQPWPRWAAESAAGGRSCGEVHPQQDIWHPGGH